MKTAQMGPLEVGDTNTIQERRTSTAWALTALSLSALLSSLGTSIANVALPTLADTFAASFQEVQWVVLAYLLTVTTLVVSAGRLGDMIGRRRLLLAGLALFTLASGVGGMAPTLWSLVIARTAQGVGAAVMMALTLALIADAVPKQRAGSAMGLLGAMSAIGTALGPSLGGLLIAGLGWRAIFLINLPLGALAMMLAYATLPADARKRSTQMASFDARGMLLLAFTLGAYALAMTLGRGRFGLTNMALLGAAALGGALFVFAERAAKVPLVRLEMFAARALRASLVMSAVVATVMMATLVVGPFYLSRALGLDAAQVGLVVSIGPAVVALVGVPSGRMADRFGATPMITAGLATVLAGSLLLSALPMTSGVVGYVAALIVLTAGYALFQTANNTEVMREVPVDQRGIMSGMLNLSRNLGLVTGASALGAVFAYGAGGDIASASPAEIASGLRTTFAVAAALATGALAMIWSSRQPG